MSTQGSQAIEGGYKDGTKRAWAIVVGLGIIHGFGMGTIMSGAGNFVVPITSDLGLLASELTLWTTFFGVFAAVAQFAYAGRLWLKFDARILVTIAFVVTMIAFALMGTYSAPWQWWISGTVIGLAGGIYFTLSKQMICPNWFVNSSGRAIGVAQFIGLAIAAAFSPIQAMLIQAIGWRMAYPVLALICCVFALPFCLFVIKYSPEQLHMRPVGWRPSENKAEAKAEDEGYVPGMESKRAVTTLVFVALFLCFGLNSLMGGFKTLYGTAADFWGYDAMFASLMVSLASLGAAVLNPIMGWAVDKLGPIRGGYVCLVLVALASCGFVFLNGSSAAVLVSVFIFECQSPLLASALPLAARQSFGPRDYPKIFSYCAIGMSFIGAFSSPIVARIFEVTGSFDGSYLALLAVVVIIALLLTLVSIRSKKLVWDYPVKAEEV